tara:strand:+ start:99 stop:251 length:153 start_codon:yes stop_codon:yes gene_type:complete
VTQEAIIVQVVLGHTVAVEAVAEVLELMEATMTATLSHTVEKAGQTKSLV